MPKGIYKRKPENNAANSKRQKGIPHTSDAQLAADEAKRGVPHTPEHNAAVSTATLGVPRPHTTPSQFASDEAQRGGNDIVEHHVSYDMKRPKALIVKITRKFHSSIHHPKGCQFGTYGYSLID